MCEEDNGRLPTGNKVVCRQWPVVLLFAFDSGINYC